MSNLQDAIIHLIESPHYKELADYKPPFNLFDVMCVTNKEKLHSRVLAWLLKDGVNKKFRYKLLNWVADQFEDDDETKCRIADTLNYNLDDIKVRCEDEDSDSGRIDIFARFQSLVIGIEVKVGAIEGPDQLRRYQTLLEKRMLRDDKSILIFLTRLGYKSTTYDKHSDVPVVCMSWRNIVEIINEVNDASEKIGEEYIFRKQFSLHIKRNILMEKEEKVIVRNLLREPGHADTIQKIINNMPSLTEYSEEWKQIVANVCDADKISLVEIKYPEKGEPYQLKLSIPKWKKAGLPFELMLDARENAVRILLYIDNFNNCQDSLVEFAKNSNSVVEFKKVPRMPKWYSVLKIDSIEFEREETIIDIYSEDWATQAEDKLSIQMEKLLPLIQAWVSDN